MQKKGELLEIEGVDEGVASELIRRAKAFLETTQNNNKAELQDDLLNLEGMTDEIAERLAEGKIFTQENLAVS